MSERIDSRMPETVGAGAFTMYPAIQTAWNKLIPFEEGYRYALRHNSSVAATFMQVLRIIIPDYDTRAKALCEINFPFYKNPYMDPVFMEAYREYQNIHPFIHGAYASVLAADFGDECLFMCGRVNDYSTYRTEKELDSCPWDIVGSEYCRCTTTFSQAMGEAYDGTSFEFNMVEARGCGDLHCRIIGENREKYPMPAREKLHENFGPIATGDLIKHTPEEKCLKDPQQFRAECGYAYRNAYNKEFSATEMFLAIANLPLGSNNVIPVLMALEQDQEKVKNVVKCVFEAAGKMAFSEFASLYGIRSWLGAPETVRDGRLLGGLIEVVMKSTLIRYTTIAFNKDEVIFDITLADIERNMPLLTTAYLSMWYGMSKTLIGAEWSVWRETEGVSDDTLRLKIAKKIDKFC